MHKLRLRHLGLLTALLALPSLSAHADTPAGVKEEAADRFKHGVTLYQAGNLNAALAEFQRAYELLPRTTVLYNIGLTYADLDMPAEATETLERLTLAPDNLSGDRLTHAKEVLEEQRAKTGTVEIHVSVDKAQLELDGVIIGTSPMIRPLRVSQGTHVVGAIATGHAPIRKTVSIVSKGEAKIDLDPPVLETRLAHLSVETALPGAEILIDKQLAAVTPLSSTLAVVPGPHQITMHRDGFHDSSALINLDEGASGSVSLATEEDPVYTELHGGKLALQVSEANATVTVDGISKGSYVEPILLAPGVHHLLIERGGFRPLNRDVKLESGVTKTVRLNLEPTPEGRETFIETTTTKRVAGLATLIAGSVVTAGSIGFLAWNNASNIPNAQSNFDALYKPCAAGTKSTAECQVLSRRLDSVNQAKSLNILGGVGIGVGVVGAVTGVVLMVTSPSVHKYDTPRGVEVTALTPIVTPTEGGAYVGLGGQF